MCHYEDPARRQPHLVEVQRSVKRRILLHRHALQVRVSVQVEVDRRLHEQIALTLRTRGSQPHHRNDHHDYARASSSTYAVEMYEHSLARPHEQHTCSLAMRSRQLLKRSISCMTSSSVSRRE